MTARWLVFHRWTRQHIISAADLVFGETRHPARRREPRAQPRASWPARCGSCARPSSTPTLPTSPGLRAAQVAWLRERNSELQRLASKHGIGRTNVLGIVPHDPVLQWREQLISDDDVALTTIANQATVDAFNTLAQRLVDDDVWRGL